MVFVTTHQEDPRRGLHPSPCRPRTPTALPDDPGACPHCGACVWQRNGTYPRHLVVLGRLWVQRWLVNGMCINTGYPPLVITLEQRDDYFRTLPGMQTGNVPTEEAAVRPLRNFLATCLAENLDFATAVAEGRTDPTWNSADANPQCPDWDTNTYPLDTTVPWLRTQDQSDDTVLKA